MRKYLVALAFLSSSVFSTAGYAQDWTGLYVGVHAGWLTGEHEGKGIYHAAPNWSGAPTEVFPKGAIDLDGGFVGGQAGYNWQIDSLVLGVEGDASWTNAGDDKTFEGVGANNQYAWNIDTEFEWIATLRGRLGVLLAPNFLVYGTGGIAWAKSSSDETALYALANGPTVRASASDTHTGWVAGAGAEWRFAQNWSLKGEWQHIDLGDDDTKFSGVANNAGLNGGVNQPNYTQDSFDGSITLDTFRIGLNYKFGEREVAASLK